jgi:cholesterol oxidase
MPDDVLLHSRYAGARAWLQYIADFGAEPARNDMCVDWDVVRRELTGRVVASQSIGEGTYGNNSGSKHSVDRNYLAQAEATGLVTVLPLHVAYQIQEVIDSDGREKFEVRAWHIDECGEVRVDKLFICDFLFLAMGAMYTPAMAVAMKAQGRLTRLNDEIGKGWSNNGDFMLVRTNLRRTVGVRQGGPGIALIHDDDNPFGPTVMQHSPMPFPSLLQMLPEGTTLQNNMTHLVMGLPRDFGHFTYDSATGCSRLTWPHRKGTTATELGALHLASRFRHKTEIRQSSRLTGVPIASRRFDLGAGITFHPLGGMVMGRACEFDGRVRGYRNLYVVDGSLLPGSAANANPAFTIAAVAERCMDQFTAHVVAQHQLRNLKL